MKSSCIQWRKPGESVKISCSPTSKEDHLYLYKFCENFPVLQWDLKDTFTIKAGWEPRVKTEVTETKGLIITIANLTAEDTGYYNCQYKVLKDFNLVVTSGAGSVLLVVHGELYFVFTTHHYVCFYSVQNTKNSPTTCQFSFKIKLHASERVWFSLLSF